MKNLYITTFLCLVAFLVINENLKSNTHNTILTIKDSLKKGPVFLEIKNFPIKKNKVILDTTIKKFFKRAKFSLLDEGEYQRMYEIAYKRSISPYADKYGFVQNQEHLNRVMRSIEPFCRNLKISIFSTNIFIDSVNIHVEDSPGFTAKTRIIESFINSKKIDSRDYLLQILDSCERKNYFLMKNY